PASKLIDLKLRATVRLTRACLVRFRDRIIRVEGLVAEILESTTVKFVRAGFGDDVDYRPTRTSELRRKSILIHLKFLHGLFRELIRWPHAAATKRLAEEGVVIVNAIDLQAVESAALSAYREIAAPRIAHDPRREGCKVLKVTAVNGQVFNRRLIDSGGHGGTCRLHQRHRLSNGDGGCRAPDR